MQERSRKVTERYQKTLASFPYPNNAIIHRALVLCHRHADVDAYCAAYGVAHFLKIFNEKISVCIGIPEGLSIPATRVASKYPLPLFEKLDFSLFDLIIVVDTGNISLLGDMADSLKNANCKKVFLDHHPLDDSVKVLADYLVINESASSASEIVFDLYKSQKKSITKIANQVVKNRLAACVNVTKISSTYTWNNWHC